MRVKNNKLKLLIIVLILFLCPFFVKISNTFGIYKSNLTTSLSLSVLDPSTNYSVTLNAGNGTEPITVFKAYGEQMGSDLYTPTRTNYNFMGWYDSNNNRVYDSVIITGNTNFHAEWAKIVCNKATVLNTETCSGSNGCRTSSIYAMNSTITYGSLYGQNSIFGTDSPKAGDAFDCDVYYDGVYDQTDGNGKHIQRFYFVREKENNGSENTAVLVYYTIFDSTGRVDTQNTSKDDIGSDYYNIASGWLPTSSNVIASAAWDNPDLVDFDGNGKISRFLSLDDFESVCGSFTLGSGNATSANTAFLEACFGDSQVNNKNWFLFENSRFQSSAKGRAGIWLETDGTYYYRIQTSSVAVNYYTDITKSQNTAKPVIEVPMSALEGFVNEDRYKITFETHGGTAVNFMRVYAGDEIGNLPTTTREHYTFDGWYATYENDTYSNQVTSSTVVNNDMVLHAKWIAKPTCEVSLVLNGGTGLTTPVIVDIGDTYNPGTPTKDNSTFIGWYTDSTFDTPYNSSVALSTSTLTLYAKWTAANYVATVEGAGSFETLKDAFENVPTTGVKTKVTLLKNISITSDSDCTAILGTQNVDFDLGGYTITSTNAVTDNVIYVNKGGTLEISNGTITNAGSKSVIYVDGSGNNKGTLYIKDGTNGLHLSMSGNYSTISNKGDTYMSSGEITSSNQPAAVNTGTDGSTNNSSATFIMTGGRITTSGAAKNQAIYNNGGARVEISGDSYLYSQSSSTLRATVTNNNGTVIITGGTIVSKNYSAVSTATGSVTIGSDNSVIDITSPVLRGKTYGLEGTNASIYDGIFESLNNTRAINVTNITKPSVNWCDTTVDVSGTTYYATYLLQPSFMVNFYPQNGDSTITLTIDNGSTIGSDMPIDPTKTDYYFDGWYDGNNLITSSTTVTSVINAYAKWVQSVNNATITSNPMSIEVGSNETIMFTETDIESVTYSSSNDNIATVSSSGVVTGVDVGQVTITMTGSKSTDTKTVTVNVVPATHTVTFYDSDGTTVLDTRTVADESSLGVNMYNPTDTNYVLEKWTIKNTPNLFTSSTTITGDVDVVATWDEKVTYATLNTNSLQLYIGETGQITLTETVQGDTVEPCTYSSGNDNYATVNQNGLVTAIGAGSTDITITGSLSGLTRTVSVTVNAKHIVSFYKFASDANPIETRLVADNGTVGANMPSNPTDSDYVFKEWIIKNTPNQFTSSTTITGDVDVVATWKEKVNITTVSPSSITMSVGGTATITVAPGVSNEEIETYTFSSSDSGVASVDSSGVVTGVTTGSATITITGASGEFKQVSVTVAAPGSTHTVTFKKEETDTVAYDTMTVNHNATLGSLPAVSPTKTGYGFLGWYTMPDPDGVKINEEIQITGDITFYAHWDKLVCFKATELHTFNSNTFGYRPDDETDLRGGWAYDCDVNGNNQIDTTNNDPVNDTNKDSVERFYYLTTDSNNNASLLFYNQTHQSGGNLLYDCSNGGSGLSYASSKPYTSGPTNAYSELPTTSQWSNVSLYSTPRQIYNELGETTGNLGTFSYTGKAARFVTYEEVHLATGVTMNATSGELSAHKWLFENTSTYNTTGNCRSNYWTETPMSTNTSRVYRVHQSFMGNGDGTSGVRPVIEVSTKLIEDFPLTYKVTFDSQGGSSVSGRSVAADGVLGALPTPPTKANNVFDGWYTTTNWATEVTSSRIIHDDVTFYAKWIPDINQATLSPASINLNVGETETISISGPNDMESYTIVSNDTSVATVDSSTKVVTGVGDGTTTITITGTESNIIRTINVSVTSPSATYTVSFYDSDGVTEYQDKSRTVNSGGSLGVNMPSDPTKTNCIFDRWYIKNTANEFTSVATITGNVDVVASWIETVTVATVPSSLLNIMSGSTNTFYLTPTSEGSVEDFTITSSSDSNIVDYNGKTIYGVAVGTATLTITGVESNVSRTITINVVNTYDVTFKDDSDNVLGTIQVVNGSTIDDTSGATLPNDPTPASGYVFDDWYIFDGNVVTTTRLDTSATVSSNIIYKPRWAADTNYAAIGTTYYPTLQDAIDAVTTSTKTEIRILQNISNPSGRTTVSSQQNIVIDAKGHRLECGGSTTGNLLFVDGGSLTVKNGIFTCGTSGLATFETSTGAHLYVESGTVENTGNRGAIYNSGNTHILGGNITSSASIRSTITNNGASSSIEIFDGTISQTAASISDKGAGTIKVEKGTVTITGGTVTAVSSNSAAVDHTSTGTLIIGTENGTYDNTNPVIQGEQYGINATKVFSLYDGIVKGKTNNRAVSDFDKITGTETGTTQETGTDNGYYTLYYISSTPPSAKYTISFNAINEDINPNSFEIDQGYSIETLPTNLTWGSKSFGGWYTDTNYTTQVTNATVPTGDVTYYAKWVYTPVSQLVTFNSTNDAMSTYFSNISTWKNLSESDFATAMSSNFTTNGCSSCGAENNCNSPTSGAYCDLPKSYNTNVNESISVYLYDNTNHVIKSEAKYANGSSGTISNLIPGQVYYWEKDSNSTINGIIEFTTPRRTLNVGNVRNVRDLGGLSASYTENNVQHTGTLKYGKLFRGAKLTSSQNDVTNLMNLGITREIDLRADSEGSGQARLPVLDNGTGGSDIVITNYLINPVAVTYSYTHGGNSYTTVKEHTTEGYPSALKSALKATMRYIVNGDSIYFHCTIGTDRTGTLAYFLEGLLGVSKEDRLEDYDLTYFYGLTNRTRYHDDLTSTSIYPRFKFMHTTYSSNDDIYNWYVNYNQESDDLTLLSQFRQAMIE